MISVMENNLTFGMHAGNIEFQQGKILFWNFQKNLIIFTQIRHSSHLKLVKCAIKVSWK